MARRPSMEKRTLNSTDLDVSRACFGTMTFGSQVDDTESRRMVDYCLDQGINFFDTANIYNQWPIGRDAGSRPSRVGGIRLCWPAKSLTRWATDRTTAAFRGPPSCAPSTTHYVGYRKQTTSTSTTCMHRTTPCRWRKHLDAMDQLVRDGKIRYVGASNYASWQLCRFHWLADRQGCASIPVSQPMYNLISSRN